MSTHTERDPLSPGWSLALGVVLLVAGVLALLFPLVAAVAAAIYFAWFALFAGVFAIVVAVRTRHEPQFGWRLGLGILYAVLGAWLLLNPLAGAAALALFVGAVLFATGIVELVLAFRRRPRRGWGWLLANGIL